MKLETEHVFMCPLCEELKRFGVKGKLAPRFVGHTEFWSV